MENNVRQILQNIISYYGRSVCDDQRKLKALLMDKCPQNKLEINMLLNALQARIPFDLMNNQDNIPPELLFDKSEQKLQKTFGLSNTNASWVVSSWSFALGIIKNNSPIIISATSVDNISNIQKNPYITMDLEDLLLDYKNLPNHSKVKLKGIMNENCIEDNETFKLGKTDSNYIVTVNVSLLPLEMKKNLMKATPWGLSFSFIVSCLTEGPTSVITVYGHTVKDEKIIIADKVEVCEIPHKEFIDYLK